MFLCLISIIATFCSTKKSYDTLEECLIDTRFRMTDGIDHDDEFIIHFQKDSVCNLISRKGNREESYPDKWYLTQRENKNFLVIDGLRLAGPLEIQTWNRDTIRFAEGDSSEFYLIRLIE